MIDQIKKIKFERILIILFLLAYFIPNFNNIDRIGNQWLYLSIISLLTLVFFCFQKDISFILKEYFNKKATIAYTIFIAWALLSICYSYNKIESLITFNQYFTVFIILCFIYLLSSKIKKPKEYILGLLLFALVIEVFLSFSPMIEDINNNNLTIRSMAYIGAAANINITAFSILYKTPFVFYFILKTNKLFIKISLSFLLLIIFFIVFTLGTRGAFIGILSIYFFALVYLIISKVSYFLKFKNFGVLLLPLLIAIILNLKLTPSNSQNALSRASTISISTEDGSVNQRIRYYKQAIFHFAQNPILGVGIGNWKLNSIDYDKDNINGYIVPYHAHNDFLQIMTELGLIGIIAYILFLFFSIKNLSLGIIKKDIFSYFLFCSFSVYFIDAMLNFPISRPISQLFLIFLLILISFNEKYIPK